ncbi:MAG: substrate-binding domain-containing protein [Defluviitaleaceae bacterium]|nr:substrate-binding domain-containing protein [Defluviitaleaceae bacterium]MCL2275580.1 substrate-binding domain-containing protein [Defluviitaleaceae bacterium]
MKKMLALLAVAGLLLFTACGDGGESTTSNPSTNNPAVAAAPTPAPAAANPAATVTPITGPIDVISRESGSGTRDAFVEILGILEDGVDRTYIEAVIQTGTGAVITAVAGNLYAIGYISLGSVRDDVRAMPINGVPATAENVQNGSYPLFRTFYLATPRNLEPLAQDFLDFIVSAEGQEIAVSRGFVAIGDNLPAFSGGGLTGTLEISGSTSMVDLMERIAAAYMELHADTRIEIHSTGSGAGITDAREGRVAFGMASRALRPAELEYVDSVTMAHDGLAVIVHNDNPIASLTTEQVRDIFMGELPRWSDTH